MALEEPLLLSKYAYPKCSQDTIAHVFVLSNKYANVIFAKGSLPRPSVPTCFSFLLPLIKVKKKKKKNINFILPHKHDAV